MAIVGWLKQSTAVTVTVGPFLDSTNGNDAETGFTLAQADIRLSKNDSAFGQKNQVSSATHKELGYYSVSLDATDTNTLGILTLAVHEAGGLAVRHDYLVLTSNVYNALVNNTGYLNVNFETVGGVTVTSAGGRPEVNATHWNGTAVTAPNTAGTPVVDLGRIAGTTVSTSTAQLGVNVVNFGGSAGTFAGGRPEVNTTHFGGTGATSSGGIPSVNTIQWRGTQPNVLISGRVDSNPGALQADVITAASIAADAIGASEIAAGAASEIAAAVLASVAEAQGSYTVQQILSIVLAAVAGVTANSGNTLKSPDGVANRIAATTNGSNERTAMTLTPSS